MVDLNPFAITSKKNPFAMKTKIKPQSQPKDGENFVFNNIFQKFWVNFHP